MHIEPESRKHPALEDAVVGLEGTVHAAAQIKPVNCIILDAPNHVLPDAVTLVRTKLLVQVVAGAACRNLGCQINRTCNVTLIIGSRSPPEFGQNAQALVRLGTVLAQI